MSEEQRYISEQKGYDDSSTHANSNDAGCIANAVSPRKLALNRHPFSRVCVDWLIKQRDDENEVGAKYYLHYQRLVRRHTKNLFCDEGKEVKELVEMSLGDTLAGLYHISPYHLATREVGQEKLNVVVPWLQKIVYDTQDMTSKACALNILGIIYYYGECGITPDRNRGLQYLLEAGNLDENFAKLNLNCGLLFSGRCDDAEVEEEFSSLRSLLCQEPCTVQHALIHYQAYAKYAQGLKEVAVKMWKTIGDNADAQAQLGAHYSKLENYNEAYKWNLKSAEQGNMYGLHNLAWMHLKPSIRVNGESIYNPQYARELFVKSLAVGNLAARKSLERWELFNRG